MNSKRTTVDLLFIGAGPVGLYGAYYAGFRGLTVAVLDSLPQVGGQISALYPEKNIYDVAGFPAVRGQQLVDNLVAQAAPFEPVYVLGQEARSLRGEPGRMVVTTAEGSEIVAGAVIVTAGAGAASPRPLPCGEDFLERGLHYFVPRLSTFDHKDVVVVGGGDSAVDWALAAVDRARSVRLIHRRRQFRAHEHSVARLRASGCELVLDAQVAGISGTAAVDAVSVTVQGEAEPRKLPAQVVVAALGFIMRLGAIADWGFEIENRSIVVDSAMRTSVPGVFAAGDITAYDGKVKLIAVGFGEVALAVNNAAAALRPESGLAPGHSSDVTVLAAR